ncbi:hypothetical protein E2C01_005710 [Portunus trituberculatus]|uniref:Uncharacterized protein n=1 Tax=Portunus trituberculatus TaxID=210409 RepID=A0A5B7CTE4_PORTR|nr:hypothetical protein [Portunus trituberculatus]
MWGIKIENTVAINLLTSIDPLLKSIKWSNGTQIFR